MKKYKYNGEAVSLGRHGYVSKGDVLDLSEEEAFMVDKSSDKDFVPLRIQRPEGFPEEPGFPPDGNHFNLSTLRWKTPGIFKDVKRMRKVKLLAAICQLEASGFPVPKVDHKSDQELMRDAILTIGRYADWI